jgi:hypothetical protein
MKTIIIINLLLLCSIDSANAFYDSSMGRWINRDPIGEGGGINLHQFVTNNPVNEVDAYGEAVIARCILIRPPNDTFVCGIKQCDYACFFKRDGRVIKTIQYIKRPYGFPCPKSQYVILFDSEL